MSNASEGQSSAARGQPESVSVYDFLYHDPQRIGSFLSQFDPGGHLTSLRRSQSFSDTSADEVAGQIGGDLAVVKGQASGKQSFGRGASEGSESIYDPLWSNARAFLDYLQQSGLLSREIGNCRIGQFVLASGEMSVLDIAMMKGVWQLPAVQGFIKQSMSPGQSANRSQRRAEAKPKAAEVSEFDLMIELLSVLPHTVQGRMLSDFRDIWCTLDQACMVISPADLLLKHGIALPGTWNIVGIVDALPWDDAGAFNAPVGDSPISEIMPNFLRTMAPITRGMLGRPTEAYGITPLLIFREVAAS